MATKTKKTAPAKKTTTTKKKAVTKGSKFACTTCGLVVSVDEVCGCVETCDIVCCGVPMKPKKQQLLINPVNFICPAGLVGAILSAKTRFEFQHISDSKELNLIF